MEGNTTYVEKGYRLIAQGTTGCITYADILAAPDTGGLLSGMAAVGY